MKKKKIIGALLSGVFILSILLTSIISTCYLQITTDEKFPIPLFILVISIFLILSISIIISIIMRIKEIKENEEEEASKY